MADIKEKVKLLVTLQEKDCAIDTLRRQAALIPVQVNEQKELLATLKKEAEDSRKGLVQLQLRRKEKEIELESKEGEIKKHGLELNSIKSNDAYKALLNQIEQCKQGKSSLESEILEIMDSAEKESAKAKDTEKQLKVKEGEMQTGISRLS
jgi:predicted  nucleic acid-binding Zn-ribbon protein